MKFCTFASGSSGNCAVVSYGKTHLLIDAGISLRRITRGLSRMGLLPADIRGVLLTHEHSDHTKALKMILKYHGLPVYASAGTAEAVLCALPELEPYITVFHAGDAFRVGEIEIRSFPTPHDTPESVGYSLMAGGRTLSFATDMGYVPTGIFHCIKGSHTVVLESNHDLSMLEQGPYPYHLKRRIRSERGHLSNRDCGILAAELIRTGTSRVILAHLSKENNTPQLAYETVKKTIEGAGLPVDTEFSLCVASPEEESPLYQV